MRIRLETTDRDPFWLIGDPTLNPRDEASDVMGIEIAITRNQQMVAGAEWEAQIAFDRQNQKLTLTGESYRVFPAEWERMAFIQSLTPVDAAELVHLFEGTVYLRVDAADEWREWPMPDAVVAIAGTRLSGKVGLYVSYRIQVGGMSSETASGYYEFLLDTYGRVLRDTSGRGLGGVGHSS